MTEGPGFNVFVIKDQKIVTPSRGVLEGITRKSAIEIARNLEFSVEERLVPADELLSADEAFATSTAGGIMPITRVNNAPVADGKMGGITKQLIDTYWEKHGESDWSVGVSELLSR